MSYKTTKPGQYISYMTTKPGQEMSYKQTVLGQYVSYLTTETRNTYIVQQHGTTAISKSSFRTLLPKLTLQSSRDIILTEQYKAEKFEDA